MKRSTTLVQYWYSRIVATKGRASSTRSVRQSVTMPAALAIEVRRVAKERHVTASRALVSLAERGVRAEADARQQLKAAYRNFVAASEPEVKNETVRELIRAIFGKDSIAEDSVFDLPRGVWRHRLQRVDERRISIDDLQQLQSWVRMEPGAPEADWYKDSGSFMLCGAGRLPKTVLEKGMKPFGESIE